MLGLNPELYGSQMPSASTTRLALGLMKKNLNTVMVGGLNAGAPSLHTAGSCMYSLFICSKTTYPFLSSLIIFFMNVKNFRPFIAARAHKEEQYHKPISDKNCVKLLTLSQNIAIFTNPLPFRRDSAVKRKNSAEVELARARIDVMQVQ